MKQWCDWNNNLELDPNLETFFAQLSGQCDHGNETQLNYGKCILKWNESSTYYFKLLIVVYFHSVLGAIMCVLLQILTNWSLHIASHLAQRWSKLECAPFVDYVNPKIWRKTHVFATSLGSLCSLNCVKIHNSYFNDCLWSYSKIRSFF